MTKFISKAKSLMFAGLAYVPQPTLPVTGQAVTLAEIQDKIELAARFLITISIVIAVIMIVWGGIQYMISRGDPAKAKSAKDIIKNGIIGAAVVLAVGVILQTVAGLVTRSFFNT
ncbi:pilin [Candidatus Parcubacteria bacterium]|nr:pilin [Candidatus Parcubacteria bacterium]